LSEPPFYFSSPFFFFFFFFLLLLRLAPVGLSSQVANPHNAFCIEQRAAAKSKEAQMRVFGLFLLLLRLAPVGLIAR
jgi:hypothetical protein